MMGSMAAFTFNDTLVKFVGSEVPLFQLLTVRGAFATVLLIILARSMGTLTFRIPRQDAGLVAIRCVAEIAAAYFFLTALLHLPIANVTAVLQVLPLTVTLGAALFFGESIGWRRGTAILLGFIGVLLIIRPGPEGFNSYSIFALIAVACVTVRDLVTRKMSAAVPSMTVTLAASASIFVSAGLASLGEGWVPLTVQQVGLIAGSSVFILLGYLFSVMVMRVGEISFIAPFRYTSLLWALLLGLVVFGDWPDTVTLIGAGIVVATGLFSFARERAKA